MAAGVARTVITATFENPTSSALEGDFTYSLPPGSVVSGYALDVNGVMVDGVLVGPTPGDPGLSGNACARAPDPGIAEVTRDNAFRTHVFPIFPGRGRTPRLEFVSPDRGRRAVFPAPIDPRSCGLRVGFGQVQRDPASRPGAGWPPSASTSTWARNADGYEASPGAGRALSLNGAVSLAPIAPTDPVSVARHWNGDSLFQDDATAGMDNTHGKHLNRERVYWDASLSRRGDDHAAELDLLSRYLAAEHPGTIELAIFADGAPRVQTFDSPTAASDVSAALKAIDYRGGTSLRNLFKAFPGAADSRLLFSDGIATIDPRPEDRPHCPLFTLSASSQADHGYLSVLARRSGGEHFDLASRPADTVLAGLTAPALRVVSITGSDGEPLGLHAFACREKPFSGRRTDGFEPLRQDHARRRAQLRFRPCRPRRWWCTTVWAIFGQADRIAELNAADQPDLETG